MQGYRVERDDNKYVVYHDDEPIAWFRYGTDTHIFMSALGAPMPDGEIGGQSAADKTEPK